MAWGFLRIPKTLLSPSLNVLQLTEPSKGRVTYNAHAQYFDQCSVKQENRKTTCQNLFASLLIGVVYAIYIFKLLPRWVLAQTRGGAPGFPACIHTSLKKIC